jgi:von Willebrand factor
VQISSLVPERWTAVVTQGKPGVDQYVTEYQVSYTMNGRDWTFVDEGRLFNGNYDRNTKVRNDFDRPVLARAIRILPTKWFGALRMRFDVIF